LALELEENGYAFLNEPRWTALNNVEQDYYITSWNAWIGLD
jgi:hypothetical protein